MALLWMIWLLSALVMTPISINAKEVYVKSSNNEMCPAPLICTKIEDLSHTPTGGQNCILEYEYQLKE